MHKIVRAQGVTTSWDHAQKKTKRYREQDSEQVAEYMREMAKVSIEDIAYVDETGIDAYLYREYGWSKRGSPLVGMVSGRKYKRTGVVAAQMNGTIISPLQYEGTMDSSLFEMWFESHLIPCLLENTVVVMGNASFHRKTRLYPLAQKAGIRLIFLPPYSPELNPIEHFWCWLKRELCKILPSQPSFDDTLRSCF